MEIAVVPGGRSLGGRIFPADPGYDDPCRPGKVYKACPLAKAPQKTAHFFGGQNGSPELRIKPLVDVPQDPQTYPRSFTP